MVEREKVIQGLGRISEWLFQQYRVVYDGDAPNYYDAYKTVDEAIELLKEQEPKLLTIEEITGDGECWFEGINGACGYADCYMCTGSKEVEVHRISMKPEYVSWNDFKKKWRCWSYRPTDEQRKAVKWDEVGTI